MTRLPPSQDPIFDPRYLDLSFGNDVEFINPTVIRFEGSDKILGVVLDADANTVSSGLITVPDSIVFGLG